MSAYPFSSDFTNFTDALLEKFKKFGTKKALIDPETGETILFEEFDGRIRELTAVLNKQKYKRGKRIATVVGNSIDFLLFVLACLKVVIPLIPINPASKNGEIEKYIQECQVDHVIREEKLLEISGAQEEISRNSVEKETNNHCTGKELALVFFSSGTTGPPKAICHNHKGLIAHLKQVELMDSSRIFPKIVPEDIIHGVLPYFHFGGLMTVFSMLASGATVIVNKKWDGEKYLGVLKQYKVTITNVVPPIMSFLAHHPLVNSLDFVHLRRIYVGAAACDPKIVSLVREKLGVEIIQIFGMTEAGLALLLTPTCCTRDDVVGLPIPGVVLEVTEEGELLVQTPTLMAGYANSSEPFVDKEGFFNTGDLAAVSPDGLVSILGRKKDTFKVRGWQVNPWELEESIKKLPGVVDCVVIGIPHEVDGNRPKAFLVGEGIDTKMVEEHIQKEFISYKWLEQIVLVKEVPRSPAGKILRRELE